MMVDSLDDIIEKIRHYEINEWFLSAARLAKQIGDYILAERLYDRAINYCNVKKWYCISVVIEKEKSRIISMN